LFFSFASEIAIMGLTCGIVGLPNVGKTTVFNALTGARAEASNYPFCTVEPNRGMVLVPDERLLLLGKMLRPGKLTPAAMEFLDVAGLVEGASRGEGLGNAFLGHLRSVDAVIHVVRMFEDSDIVHLPGSCEPVRDIRLIQTELVLADLEVVERRLEKVARMARVGNREAVEELDHLRWIREQLGQGIPLSRAGGNRRDPVVDHAARYKDRGLLTDRPVFYVLNLGEQQLPRQEQLARQIRESLADEDAPFLPLCAKLEREILDLEPEEQKKFRLEMETGPSGLDRLVGEAFRLLDLILFYTIVGPEVRAWILKRGATVYQAAGRIHSDLQRGFIRAEVIRCDAFLQAGSEEKARETGLIHAEGRDYEVQDRDIVRIRFH